MGRLLELSRTVIALFFFSYLMNFVWEALHAVFLYEGHDFSAEKYVRMVGYVSAVDALFILAVYFFMSMLWRDLLWMRHMNKRQAAVAWAVLMGVAALLEYEKVHVFREWRYNTLMPTIFDIGLSPLLQLSVTGLVTFRITRKVLTRR